MSNKKRRKSKAAEATAAKRAARAAAAAPKTRPAPKAPGEDAPHRPEIVEFEGGGGVMTKLRGGFQSAVGSDAAPKKKSWLSTVMWALIVIGAVFMFMGSYL